ncbi:hypothetical protein LNO19_26410, partial [Klebsiella quasipneumoniae subsp. similipneumoniae]|nr:hypothetical protein [Klebsiella quasipneumoniae subsp. similipneumoniae]
EISQKQDHFQANTSELVQLAAQHSPTFQALPAERQSFFRSVLSMPVFFLHRSAERRRGGGMGKTRR